MIETFVLIYGAAVVFGSWLMLKGIDEAPIGFEDEDGFHYLPENGERLARVSVIHDSQQAD